MKKILLILYLCFPTILLAQSDLFTQQRDLIGTKINEIDLTDYIQNQPDDKNFNGKFKVLEFWATWCKPCLAAVPHLNKLQEKFKNQNIVFLSITHEKPAITTKTLQKVKFKTIVVSDTTRTIHKRLKIQHNGTMPLPRTVLIDNENKIVWYGSPTDLTTELIEKFLNKESFKK